MPVYEFECRECENGVFQLVLPVGRRKAAECPKCGAGYEHLDQIFSTPPEIVPDWTHGGYWDHGMGCYVKSKRHRKEEMKRRGLKESNESVSEMKELLREANERKADKRR